MYILHDASLVVCLSEYLPFLYQIGQTDAFQLIFVPTPTPERAGPERSNLSMSFWP